MSPQTAPKALRDGPFAFLDLLHATTSYTTHYRILADVVFYVCGACEAVFEQTDEGHRALRDHELEHGRSNCVNLSELDGKTLRIVTWAPPCRDGHKSAPEIWAVDDQAGVVYHLSNAYQGDTIWKWRIKAGQSGVLAYLNAATPSDPG